jgi:hypothetical protein
MADSPFVVQIPEGATEIDLGPLLRPLVWAIREEVRNHGHNRSDRVSSLEPDSLDRVMVDAIDGLQYQILLRKLEREVLVAYLLDNDWIDEDGRGYSYVRSYYKNDHPWNYKGDRVRLGDPSRGLSLPMAEDALRSLAYWGRLTSLQMIQKVLSYANVLDRIVNEIETE